VAIILVVYMCVGHEKKKKDMVTYGWGKEREREVVARYENWGNREVGRY
jgi:hypothetical protein